MRAWATYEPAAIGKLFSEDAEYRYHPWAEGRAVLRGRDAIVANWLEHRDRPGTYEGKYRPLVVHGSTVIAVGISNYYSDATRSKFVRGFHNLWVLEFDRAGRCRSFTEWFMKSPTPNTSK